MEASDEMGKRERRYPVLLYLLAIPLMIPVVRLALLAFPMIPRFYQGFLPFRYNSFYIDRGGPARTCETPGEGGNGDVVKGETSDNGWRRRDCGVQGMNGWSFWQGPLHSVSTHHIADCITRRSRSSNLSCRGLDPYIVGGIPGGRDFQLVFLALLA